MIRVGVLGSTGRMGAWVTQLARSEFKDRVMVSASAGRGDSLAPLLDCDVIIDFSTPKAVLALLKLQSKLKQKPAWIIGSTGWTPAQLKTLKSAARKTWILRSSNFSTGVLCLMEILKTAAPILKRFGYLPVISETHHRHKKDAPSGTAISLQEILAHEYGSKPQTHSVRAGEIIGDHEIMFFGTADRLSLGHFAQDRSIFARGAIDAAIWLVTKKKRSSQRPTGLLSMSDLV